MSEHRTERRTTLRRAIEVLLPIVRKLLEVERDAIVLDRQFGDIPSNVRRGEGPEHLLEAVQEKINRRFRQIVGKKPDGDVLPDDVRDVLRRIEGLANLTEAAVDVSPLPVPDRESWTADLDFYENIEPSGIVGGVHPIRRLRFTPDRKIVLAADGSLR